MSSCSEAAGAARLVDIATSGTGALDSSPPTPGHRPRAPHGDCRWPPRRQSMPQAGGGRPSTAENSTADHATKATTSRRAWPGNSFSFIVITSSLLSPLMSFACPRVSAAGVAWPTHWGVSSSAPPGGVLGGCSHLFGFSAWMATRGTHQLCRRFEAKAPYNFRCASAASARRTRSQFACRVPSQTSLPQRMTSSRSLDRGGTASSRWVGRPAGSSPGLRLRRQCIARGRLSYDGHGVPAGVSCNVTGSLALCFSPTAMGMPWGLAHGGGDGGHTAATAACPRANCGCALSETISARLQPYSNESSQVSPAFAEVSAKALW